MPSHQTPAQKAANQAFHRKEEAKKGKKTRKAEKEEKKPVRRSSRKSARRSELNRPAVLFLIALIVGGLFVELLYLVFGRNII